MRNYDGKEDIELFKRALCEGLTRRIEKEEKEAEGIQLTPNKRHKKKTKEIFYEQLGDAFTPFSDEK